MPLQVTARALQDSAWNPKDQDLQRWEGHWQPTAAGVSTSQLLQHSHTVLGGICSTL